VAEEEEGGEGMAWILVFFGFCFLSGVDEGPEEGDERGEMEKVLGEQKSSWLATDATTTTSKKKN
jgi:hypothetical protein